VEEAAGAGPTGAGVIGLVKADVERAESFATLRVTLVLATEQGRFAGVCVGISEGTASPTLFVRRNTHLAAGETELRCSIAHLPLPRGRFTLWVGAFEADRDLLPWQPAARFDVLGGAAPRPPHGIVRLSPVHVDATWEESPR